MEKLKEECHISNARLGENLLIEFDIRMEGKVLELWTNAPMGGKINAWVSFYGDDAQLGDEFLLAFDYPMKLSNPGTEFLEERAQIPFQGPAAIPGKPFILDEDKKGRDEVYAIFYLTMTFNTSEGFEVDAVISDLVRTNTLKKELKVG